MLRLEPRLKPCTGWGGGRRGFGVERATILPKFHRTSPCRDARPEAVGDPPRPPCSSATCGGVADVRLITYLLAAVQPTTYLLAAVQPTTYLPAAVPLTFFPRVAVPLTSSPRSIAAAKLTLCPTATASLTCVCPVAALLTLYPLATGQLKPYAPGKDQQVLD